MSDTEVPLPIADTVVLLPSFDGFSDMWPITLECLSRFWPDRPYPLVCVSQRKPWGDYPVLTWDDKGWRNNLLFALDRLPKTRFVVMYLEDMFPTRPVDTDCVRVCEIALSQFDNVGAIRLGNGDDKFVSLEIPCVFGEVLRGSAYRISTAPTLWRVSYLRKILERCGDTAWEFEMKGTELAKTLPEDVWCPNCKEHERPFRCWYTGVTRGLWNRACLNWLNDIGVEVGPLTRGVIE